MVVAPGRMIDSFLSIPDAESLPLYRMVLKLACVCGTGMSLGRTIEAIMCKPICLKILEFRKLGLRSKVVLLYDRRRLLFRRFKVFLKYHGAGRCKQPVTA
jgi:hypothetical protein